MSTTCNFRKRNRSGTTAGTINDENQNPIENRQKIRKFHHSSTSSNIDNDKMNHSICNLRKRKVSNNCSLEIGKPAGKRQKNIDKCSAYLQSKTAEARLQSGHLQEMKKIVVKFVSMVQWMITVAPILLMDPFVKFMVRLTSLRSLFLTWQNRNPLL